MGQWDASSYTSFPGGRDPRTPGAGARDGVVDPVEVLQAGQSFVDIPLRDAVLELHPYLRRVAAYHLGLTLNARARSWELTIHPTMALLAAEATGGDPLPALPVAVAAELAQGFWLLHEDAADGILTRNQRPAAWVAFGLRATLLAAQSLSALAVETLTTAADPRCAVAVKRLAQAQSELVRGKAQGSWLDTRADVSVEEYLEMAAHQAALFGYSAATGALMGSGHVPTADALGGLGRQLCLIHQLAVGLRAAARQPREPGAGGASARICARLPVGRAWARGEIRRRRSAALDVLERIDMPARTRDELASLTRYVAGGASEPASSSSQRD